MPVGTVEIILRLATVNPISGSRRIDGELATMGFPIAPSNVWAILMRHDVEP